MDALTFTSSVVQSLSWPAASLGIAAILRRDISVLLRRLKLFKGPGGWEAEFEELEKVRGQADQLIATRVAKELESAPATKRGRKGVDHEDATQGALTSDVTQLLALAEISPPAAVTEAWSAIERELVSRARLMDALPEDRYMPTRKLVQLLAQRSEAIASIAPLLSDLNRIRNNAAHGRDEPISRDASVEYVLTAARVLTLLRISL